MAQENKDLVENLYKEYFFDYLEAKNKIKEFFESLTKDLPYERQIGVTEELFSKIGKKTYHKIVGKVLKGFSKIQTSLFGIELEEKEGKRYRDHYIHTFNVYIFGSIIISQLIDKIKVDEKISEFFKVKKERVDIQEAFLKEVSPYDIRKRLFFIWTFMVLYHDVGIPISHLERIRNRLNVFFENFGFILHEFFAEFQDSIRSRLNYFMDLLTKMYKLPNNEKGIKFKNENYELSDFVDPHLKNVFLKAFNEKNHGIISAICFYKCIIDSLSEIGKDNKKYRKWVLEQDVTRIALAIALHDLYKYDTKVYQSNEKENKEKIFPISFKDFPLTFMLILLDQTQEYYRPEGISLNRISKLKNLPEINVELMSKDPFKFKIQITLLYSELKREKEIIDDFKNFKFYEILQKKSSIDVTLEKLKQLKQINTIKEVLKSYWKEIETNIKNRLKFGANEPISVYLTINLDGKTIKDFYFG